MELKRIIAKDSRSANERAIALYGPEVLVISTQRIDNQTELIVAVDVVPDGGTGAFSQSVAAAPAPTEKTAAFRPFAEVYADMGAALSEVQEEVADSSPAVQALGVPTPSEPVHPADDAAHEAARSREIVSLLRDEIQALKREFAMSRGMGLWSGTLAAAPVTRRLAQAFSEVGVPAALQALLLDAAHHAHSEMEALQAVQALLVKTLSPVRQRKAAKAAAQVRALVGPSGAGKTTMLGRLLLAADTEQATEQAIISFNDLRPGAWSQIQMVAAQAGIPCYRARTAEALKTLLTELQGSGTVWIDTPGLDFMGQASILTDAVPQLQLELVLPVDATWTHARKICSADSPVWSRLWLSKLDESAMPWPLIAALCESPQPVSGFACSESVQTPVQGYDPQTLVSLALAPVTEMLELSESVIPELPSKAVVPRKTTSATTRRKSSPAVARNRKTVIHEQA